MRKNLIYFFIGIFLGFLFVFPIDFFQKSLEDFFYAQIGKPFEEIPLVEIKTPKRPPLNLDVESALSLKIFSSGREKILFKKNPEKILPIASLTKLMTAIIAFENYDLYEEIKISKKAASQQNVPNYGNLKEGEVFSVKKLLSLMLVYSSNDAAFALAEKMGVKKFVEKMNQKAREIGMKNTTFFNPTGLKDGGLNVSTAEDLAKLVKYILREKPEILRISTEKTIYDAPHSIFEIKLLDNQKLIGGKTGFLPGSEIGNKNEGWGCMVFVFKNEKGILFLNIILGAKSSQERIIQMQKLVDWINGKI